MKQYEVKYQFDYVGLIKTSLFLLLLSFLVMYSIKFRVKESFDFLIFLLGIFFILFSSYFALGALRCYRGNFITASSKKIFVPDIFLSHFNRSIQPSDIDSMEIKQYDKKSFLFIYLKNDKTIVIGSNAIPELTLDNLKIIFEECKKINQELGE